MADCASCGDQLGEDASFCASCGVSIQPISVGPTPIITPIIQPSDQPLFNEHLSSPVINPVKSWGLALFLSATFGLLAIDRFYLGKIVTGILKLLTVGGLGIWWLVDFILIAVNDVSDARGNPLRYEGSGSRVWWRVATSSIFISIAAAILLVGLLAVFKGFESYKLATQFASENELIKAEIGEVTGFGFLPQGNISTNSSSSSSSGRQTTGQAAFLIKVHGDKGKGELHVNLIKRAGGDWQIVRVIFVTDTGKQIELLVP